MTGGNTPWTANPGHFLQVFYKIFQRAGIGGVKRNGSVDIHSLRVPFITLSIEHGGNPKALQEISATRRWT